MAVIDAGPAGASAPAGLDELATLQPELHDAPAPAIRRLGELSRPCRCNHPLGVVDDWYPSWVRCLLCGRDVRTEQP